MTDERVAGGRVVGAEQPARPAAGKALRAPHRRETAGPRLREKAAVNGYRAGTWIVGRLPYGPTVFVGGWIAEVVYLAWPRLRANVRANAAHVLGVPQGDRRVGRLARSIFRNQVRWAVEMMRFPRLTPAEHAARFHGPLADTVHEVWLASNGLILAGLHIGSGEAVAAALGERGWPTHVVADDTAYEELFEDFRALRRSWGVEVIPWRNLRDVYRVLRRKEILGLLVDWGYRPEDQPVRFFDSWTTLPAGPAVLAARTGATIIPFWTWRRTDGIYTGSIGDPILVPSTAPADIARATQAIADALERGIRTAPDQWVVFKPMWPADPAEEERLAARAAELADQTDPVAKADAPSPPATAG